MREFLFSGRDLIFPLYYVAIFYFSLQNYVENNLTIGYNPFSTETTVFLCPTLESVHQLQDKLKSLQQEYKARVHHAKVFIPRLWTSLGSEEEVDQERAESTREKVMEFSKAKKTIFYSNYIIMYLPPTHRY